MNEPVEKGFRDLMTGVADAYQSELMDLYIQLECIRDSLKDLECKRMAKRVEFIANRLQSIAFIDIPAMLTDPIGFAEEFDNIEPIEFPKETTADTEDKNN